MPTAVKAYGATSATDPLVPLTIERRDPGPHDVVIAIRYAGICHSDIHTVREEWGPITFPQVVGHEIVGEVTATGAEVTKHAIGDRVGVGCMVNSCRECDACIQGLEQYCEKGNIGTYDSIDVDGSQTHGGYSTQIVVNEDFVLRVPESIPYEKAAPLLCAGITTYSPLKHWGVGPGSKVAIVGMGGLGHMGVKIAVALGADVTVLSHTLSKQADGLAFGATGYRATNDRAVFAELQNTFDFVLSTISAPFNVGDYLRIVKLGGSFVTVGLPPEPLEVRAVAMLKWKSFAGSSIGGIRETQEMLDFCAEHDIAPETELIAADQINEAYERVMGSDVRYRFVIDIATLH
ncbi:MAG: NAD(P)-dependent alcohol dehydrogenase [Microbacterium sp.]